MSADAHVFARAPLRVQAGIPIFSESTPYIANYEKIAADHLASLRRDGTNPFMPEETWQEMEESTAGLVRGYSAPGQSVLDVGVGLGRLLARFPELRRHGMDISLEYLEVARGAGISVCYSLVEDMPYRADLFDVVVCTDVLEHVLDLNLCVGKMLSVLKPGGVLIVRVPYREELACYAADSSAYEYVHLRSFDEHSLRLLFARIFECEVQAVVTAVHAIPRLAVRLTRTEPLARRSLALLRALRSSAYDAWRRRLYRPIEINMVVRKAYTG
jgi:2-polyprenyl-3-methyl-5-hydroxy-6-metoxy-1,4-benzoquinol methylase